MNDATMPLDELLRSQLLPFLKDLADRSLENAAAVKFDKEHPQHLYAMCTYGTILETTYDILALVDAAQFTSVPIILRALLDAYASFRSCFADPNHFKAMYATYIKEKLRLLDAVVENPDNPYLQGVAEAIDLQSEKESLNQELQQMKEQGYAPLRPWQEFERADLSSEYQSLYWQLCLHAHNNVAALEERHLEKKGDDYTVAFFKMADAADLVRYLDSVSGILLDASKTLHSRLGSPASAKYGEFDARLQEIRKQYPLPAT
jgi:hypothetical protein